MPRAANRTGIALALAAGAALVLLKLVYIFVLPANSDEPQHLHVVWAWTTGQLPYRDVFDNHAPLFQLLWSPLLAALGERADIVGWMRLSVLPLYFACLALTWRLGKALWSRAVAIAATVLAALFPVFFTASTQFRPDDLWSLLWLATIAILVDGRLDVRRGAWAGIAAGAALAVSLKTVPLLLTALLAAGLVAIAMPGGMAWRERLPWRAIVAYCAAALVVPGVLTLYFIAHDAGPAMRYALFEHNLVDDLGRWQHGDLRFVLAPLTLPVAFAIARLTRPAAGDPLPWARRCFVMLAAAGYAVSLYGYWPLITRQDLLPLTPFAALAAAALLEGAGRLARTRRNWRVLATASLATAELAVLVCWHPPWEWRLREYESRLARVLELTRPGDFVMDAKGDSIYRQRPVYWVLETITLARMRDGSIGDDIAARLAATATPVVWPERLPEADLPFIERNYLPVDEDLRIAGKYFHAPPPGRPITFTIALPLDYALATRSGATTGTIDGKACAPSCRLDRGKHEFMAARDEDAALLWAPALGRGLDVGRVFAAQRPY